jgi:hypothetical protein
MYIEGNDLLRFMKIMGCKVEPVSSKEVTELHEEYWPCMTMIECRDYLERQRIDSILDPEISA